MTPRPQLLRILSEIHDRPWAITARALNTIAEIAERQVDFESVAAKLGRPMENTGNGTEVRNGVAILAIEGPLFRYANLFTAISGATSVQVLATEFQAALDNPNVSQILLNVNSPGGQVDGIQELADQIREGSKVKPVTAYVDGMAASGGYWLAAAAPTIIASESALLGSIGVVASIVDNRGAQERQGVKRYEIVSSQSPFKRPDVTTEAGRAQIQETVDALAEIFIGRMAAYRGTDVEDVERNYGQGKVLVASRAVAAGMADEVSNFEPLVARLAAATSPRAVFITQKEDVPVADNPNPAPAAVTTGTITGTIPAVTTVTVVAAPAPAPQISERERIAAILNAPEAAGREELARHLALSTDMAPEAARAILAAAPSTAAAPAAPSNPLAREMAGVKNPVVGVAGPATDDTPAAEAARVLAFVPKDRKVSAA